MKKAKRKQDWLLYFIGGIAALIAIALVLATHNPNPFGIRAASQYTLGLECNAISVVVKSLQGEQTSNNYVYAINVVTKEQYNVQEISNTDIELPINLESPITRDFATGQLPSGTYDVFLKDANHVILASLAGVEKNNCL